MNDVVDVAEEYGPALGDFGPDPVVSLDRRRNRRAYWTSSDGESRQPLMLAPFRQRRYCECCSAQRRAAANFAADDDVEKNKASETISALSKMRDRPEWSPGLIARALVIGLGYMVGGNSYNSPNGLRVLLFILLAILINEFAHALIKMRRRAYYSSLVEKLERGIFPPEEIEKIEKFERGQEKREERSHPELWRSELIGCDATLIFDSECGRFDDAPLPKQRRKYYRDRLQHCQPPAVGLRLSDLASDLEVAEFVEKVYGLFEHFSIILRYFTITAITYAANEALKKLFYGADELIGIVYVLVIIFVLSEILEILTTTYFPHPQFHR